MVPDGPARKRLEPRRQRDGWANFELTAILGHEVAVSTAGAVQPSSAPGICVLGGGRSVPRQRCLRREVAGSSASPKWQRICSPRDQPAIHFREAHGLRAGGGDEVMHTPSKRFHHSLAAALLLGLSLAIPAAAGPARTAQIHIDNFGQIDPNYYRGAQPKGADYADLRSLGVKTIIDLTKDGDPAEAGIVQSLGMKFHRLEMTTRETPSAEKIAQFLQIVNDPASQPVYVHCQGGRHRTGVMTAVYRMTESGWSADRAFAEMKQFKFGADFLHPEFKRFVYTYHPVLAAVTAAAKPVR